MEIISSYFENKYCGQNATYMMFKSAVTKDITEL
jgi:hypothetical protein